MDNLDTLWDLVKDKAPPRAKRFIRVEFNLDYDYFSSSFFAGIRFHAVEEAYIVTPEEAISMLDGMEILQTYVCCVTFKPFLEEDGKNCAISVDYMDREGKYALTIPGMSFYPVHDYLEC